MSSGLFIFRWKFSYIFVNFVCASFSILIKSVHIVGIRGKGLKGYTSKAIEQMTNTRINFRGRGGDPRIIKITSHSTLKYFADQFVMHAKTLIMKSLLVFLADPRSERRLVYEMGLAATGTLKIHKVDDTVQEICHQTEKLVWMKLFELPHNEMYSNRNVSTVSFLLSDKLQRELTSKTSCCIEVYGLNNEPSMLCTPYVFMYGNDAGEVNDVAAKVACLIKQHPQKCQGLLCQNDTVSVENSRVVKKIFIPTDQYSGYNFRDLIIGPEGSMHQKLVASSGGGMNIQIKIRGGNREHQEPLHVILDGIKASVDKAEKLIMELLEGCQEVKAVQLESLANRKRKTLLDTDSLSEHGDEHPRKSCKVMGKNITLTIPSWVMKTGNDFIGKYEFLIMTIT